MVILSRRDFLRPAEALSAACVGRGTRATAPVGAAARVRKPVVGQSWRYARHDLVTGTMVATQIDRVSAVGQSIEIESHSEATTSDPRGRQAKHGPKNRSMLASILPNASFAHSDSINT
jgi:hypothetical protein